MTKYSVTAYTTQALAEAALEALDTTVDATIEPYSDGGLQKWVLVQRSVGVTSITQLTAPGASEWIPTGKNTHHTLTFTIAAVNTNVVMRAEGSVDGTIAFNLNSAETDTTITSNGTRSFKFEGALSHIRLNFVSESGGTDATIDAKYTGV